ncbi:restriction endonuclease [Streptomyces sp. MRC013]|uniref:restriction endonuclease n=1 Tax=Streptomyces sp. MRC013 TaxID=2898276 RepID=UPI0032EA63D6
MRARGLRYGLVQLDGLHHARFEEAVRDLMRRDGCRDAVRVGGGGDLGADVKATDPYGRRWVIQCKHRGEGPAGSAVGTPDLQVLNGTARQVHGADVAVIVTDGRVTAPAVAFARQQRLHVVDRRTLGVWASGSRPLWELLRAVPRPAGRPPCPEPPHAPVGRRRRRREDSPPPTRPVRRVANTAASTSPAAAVPPPPPRPPAPRGPRAARTRPGSAGRGRGGVPKGGAPRPGGRGRRRDGPPAVGGSTP